MFVERHGDRPRAKNVIILITNTDGNFGNEAYSVEKSATRLINETNTHLTVIGPHVDRSPLLKKLSENNIFTIKRDFRNIKDISHEVLKNIEDG